MTQRLSIARRSCGITVFAAHDIVISDLRHQPKDRSAYLAWAKEQEDLWIAEYAEKAEITSVSKSTTYPSRGLILDREGKLLINNNPVYDIY